MVTSLLLLLVCYTSYNKNIVTNQSDFGLRNIEVLVILFHHLLQALPQISKTHEIGSNFRINCIVCISVLTEVIDIILLTNTSRGRSFLSCTKHGSFEGSDRWDPEWAAYRGDRLRGAEVNFWLPTRMSRDFCKIHYHVKIISRPRRYQAVSIWESATNQEGIKHYNFERKKSYIFREHQVLSSWKYTTYHGGG